MVTKASSLNTVLPLIALIILCGCGRCNPLCFDPEWRFQRTSTGECCYDSARLYLPANDPLCSLELELVRGPESVRMYVNLLNEEVSLNECEERAEVIVTVDGQPSAYLASVFEGNQRLLLPVPAAEQIVQGLLSNQCVEVQVTRTSLEIASEGFQEGYRRLLDGTDPILTWDNAWRLCGIER